MWEYFSLALVTLTFVLYLLKTKVDRGDPDYWTKRGFPTITNTISTFELLTGRKGATDGDMEHYKSLGDQKYGGVMEFGTPVVLIKDLDLARDVLIKDFDHFFDRRDAAKTEPIFDEAVFNLKGQTWKDMRTFLSPAFTSGRIRRMFPHFGRSSQNLRNYITSQPSSHPKEGIVTRVNEAMRKFSVDVICATAFGMSSDVFSNPDSEFFKMAEKMGTFSLLRRIRSSIFSCFPKMALFLNISFAEKDSATYFGDVLRSVHRQREGEGNSAKRDDFLQLLVEARKGGLKIDESELSKEEKEAQLPKDGGNKNNVVWTENIALSQSFVFILAGFDSISNNLSVIAHQLATYPELQEKVFQEIDGICGNDEDITYDDVNAMEYLDNFISETLRMYPPLTRIERKCMMDYPIPGTKHVIPKGTIVAIPAESIHKDEKYWPNPTQFDPDRFNAENKASRNSYAYMPFGIGPRNCIGMRFALVETKVALANILKNFELTPTASMPGPVNEVFGYRLPLGANIGFIPRN